MTKKLFIKSFGCQMNVYDSERMAEVLAPLGYGAVDDGADADMVLQGHMASQVGTVGHGHMVPDLAVVPHMRIHQE